MSDDAHVPGWYSDPTGRHALRWWDGAQWTGRVAEATEDDEVVSTPATGVQTVTAVEPPAPVLAPPPSPEPEPEAETEPISDQATPDRRPPLGDALGRIGLALVAAVIMLGASFLTWIDTKLPQGSAGNMTGWELADIPKLTTVQQSDPRPEDGPSFATVDALAAALNAGGFPCALVADPAAISPNAPFSGRGACGPPPPGAPPGTPPQQVYASATPKFTVSPTTQQNSAVVDGYLNAVDHADAGPGIRGYGLILYGPNWSMSASDKTLVKAKAAIGGTLMSTDLQRNQFYVADLFKFGFFTGLTTVILAGATALLAAVFALAVVLARRSGRPVPAWRALGAPLVVAGLAGAIGLNWISWFTRGDGYSGVRLEIGFFLVTFGAFLAVWALASFITYGDGSGAKQG